MNNLKSFICGLTVAWLVAAGVLSTTPIPDFESKALDNEASRHDMYPSKDAQYFANAFCAGNEEYVRAHVSGILMVFMADVPPGQLFDAGWDCSGVERYLGYGDLINGNREEYFRITFSTNSPTYGFIFDKNGNVVGID